jgi:hypothetical protein
LTILSRRVWRERSPEFEAIGSTSKGWCRRDAVGSVELSGAGGGQRSSQPLKRPPDHFVMFSGVV